VKQHNASGVIAVKVTNPSSTATNYALALSRLEVVYKQREIFP